VAFQPKRVLVLGTTGECGGRIAKGCVDAGHQVSGVSRNKNQAPTVNLDGVERLQGDKGDPETFTSVLAGREFDVVVDSVPKTEDVKVAFEHLNGRIEHYFMISSTGTYAPLLTCPADESNPWREETGINFYWQSQRDTYALGLFKDHGFPATIFRPTNIIGRHRIPLELWGGRNIKYFQLMREGKTVEIPETDQILLQSGCNDDLATAFVLGASEGPEINGQIYIISCKRAVTLATYFQAAREILGSKSEAEVLPIDAIAERRADDVDIGGMQFLVEHMCFDIGKAERELGYAPKVSMEQGLEQALQWCLDEGLLS
jgi:nucleoside-diphosphate-sugar epimerase